jgi:hypothetical protein
MTHDDAHTPDLTLDDPLAQRLLARRPAPRATYRGALRRRLVALGPPTARPPRLKTLAALYAAGGVVALVLAVLSVAGVGPLAS